ncbi:hypothetical protein ABVT39_004173 [Epinephelus coioides]
MAAVRDLRSCARVNEHDDREIRPDGIAVGTMAETFEERQTDLVRNYTHLCFHAVT